MDPLLDVFRRGDILQRTDNRVALFLFVKQRLALRPYNATRSAGKLQRVLQNEGVALSESDAYRRPQRLAILRRQAREETIETPQLTLDTGRDFEQPQRLSGRRKGTGRDVQFPTAKLGYLLRLGQGSLTFSEFHQHPAGSVDVPDTVPQDQRIERLAEKIRRANVVGPPDRVVVLEPRQKDDRSPRTAGEAANPATSLNPVHLRHHDIEEHQVRRLAREQLERLPHAEAGRLNSTGRHRTQNVVVVDNENHRIQGR